MTNQELRAPAAQLMQVLQARLQQDQGVPLQELWRQFSGAEGARSRDGLRMLIESEQLTLQAGPAGPLLRLPTAQAAQRV